MLLTNLCLAVLYGITTIVFIALSLYVWRRRSAPGSSYFSLLMASAAMWSTGNMLQMAIVDMQLQIIFAKLTYIGVVAGAVFWLMFTVAYSQRSRNLGRKYLLLWVVPIIFLSMVFTNEMHHLVWISITQVTGEQTSLLSYEYGIGIWVNLIYSYSLMLAGTLLLVFASLRTYKQFTLQTMTLVLGAMIPYVGNIVYLLWLNRYAAFDPTPFAVATTGLIYAWSMFRYQLFDLVPLARETVVTNMVDAVVVIDELNRVIDINPAARRLCGHDIAAGQPVATALALWPELLEYCTGPGEDPKEVSIPHPEGTLWLDASVSPVRDNRGQVTSRILIMRDITNRKMAEKALEETRNNFKTLFNTVDDLLVVMDEKGRILEVNSTIVSLFGYSQSEVVGKSIFDLLQIDVAENPEMPAKAMLAGLLEKGPVMLPVKSGGFVSLDTSLASGLWNGREAIFGVSRDVSDLVHNKEQLRRSNDSLLLEVEERKRAEQQMEKSLREKELLMKEIHDRVKNNMDIISGLLNLQIAVEGREEMIEAFRGSRDRIKSMALVHETLKNSPDSARIDFARYTAALTTYLLGSYAASSPGVRLVVEGEEAPVNIDTAVPCGLIVCELVSNSLKYGFPEGRPGNIRVRIARAADMFTLTVADDGVGIPSDVDYRQACSLGFQLVNVLVDQLEGRIDLDTDGGTKFAISFKERTPGGFFPATPGIGVRVP